MSTLVFPPLDVVVPPKAPLVQNYTTSQNVNKPAGARYVVAEGISGGQAGATTSGGRGGNYGTMLIDASTLPASIPLTIGAGGATSGALGGDTSFGPLTVRHGATLATTIASNIEFDRDGGAPGWSSATKGCSSLLGAGGGGAAGSTGGGAAGGTGAAAVGALQAGGGGNATQPGAAPGGGGGGGSPIGAGAPGASRLTWIF